MYYKYSIYHAGHKKHSLPIDNSGVAASFSYTEKGSRTPGKPTIVFVHGLSSSKEGWMSIVEHIPADHHCITVDLPGHGETVGFSEDMYSIDKFIEKLKLFFDKMKLIEPMCIIGASMGASIVCLFAAKYPEYVCMICLMAPIANEEAETDLIRQLRAGVYNGLLPETTAELRQMIRELTVKRPYLPRPILNGFMHMKLLLASLFEYDYPQIERHYEKLRQLNCPALILWGRQDKVYAASGAEYFRTLLSNSEHFIMDDCGHDMAIDKPTDTASSILTFYERNMNRHTQILSMNDIILSTEC
ncbi:unnamed protein product [Adineta steineri]|uniref:acylglycerol lipase n=2 Tax=Adineta steineri TaxID=433720 RepID=A0A814W304_9BILA|nr:unnamed protein product [Adineta steineri]CAF3900356.1 unnamed protein product [Adineta steineri]